MWGLCWLRMFVLDEGRVVVVVVGLVGCFLGKMGKKGFGFGFLECWWRVLWRIRGI